MSGNRVLVPVSRSRTLRATVEYAVDRALAGATATDPGLVRFVFVHSPESMDDARETAVDAGGIHDATGQQLLDRARVWASENVDDTETLTLETAHVGTDDYLFSPADVADHLLAEARANDVDRVVLDPEYDPGIGAPLLRPLEYELTREQDIVIEEAPVTRQTRRAPLIGRGTPLRVGALFGISFLFYQFLAGIPTLFDVVTGVVSATIVAVALSRVTFGRDPSRRTPLRLLRAGIYVPYLLWEIIKANVVVATVILRPSMPVDPRMTKIRPAVWGGLPVTTLANSITLTPGTLSVRVSGRELYVHTLIPSARQDLFDGGLERAVRFLFYGRTAMRIDPLDTRGEAEILNPPDEKRTGGDKS